MTAPAQEQISGQREPRTNPPRKRAWKRALRLLIIAGVCFYRGKRYAVEDGSAAVLADPDTLSTLRTTLLQPRPDPPKGASDARVTSANRGTMLRCISYFCEKICKLDRLPELCRDPLRGQMDGKWKRALHLGQRLWLETAEYLRTPPC